MTLFTFRNDKKTCLRPLLIYIGVTIFCAIFGLIYEFNSHNIFSNYMLFGFLWPLIGGVGFYGIWTLLFFVFKYKNMPSVMASYAYNAGLATFTVGCYFHGIIEIYGTTRDFYVILYTVLGSVLCGVALILYITSFFLRNKQEKDNI